MTTSKEIVDRIDTLLKARNEKRQALYDYADIASNTFPNWTKREDTKIPAQILFKIAEYLNVSMEYLLTGIEKQVAGLSAEEQSIIDKFRILKRENQITVIDLINSLALLNQQNQNAISAG